MTDPIDERIFGGMCAPVKKTKKPRAHPEKIVQRAIQDAFRLKFRVALVHVDAGGAGFRSVMGVKGPGYSETPAGFPDLVGCFPPSGRAVYIEVKAPGGKLSLLQERMLQLLREKGAVAFMADSVDSALAQFAEQTRRSA